ncbi:MAG: Fic family protein [Bifidobacteriaceae bacterium]|jgi:Fic family protein|nr:Fic family protein [Bifidobacteriaceae bacterium]
METPPFNLSANVASLLTHITEEVTRMQMRGDFERILKLRKQNRILSIHSSTAIEANTLSLKQVTDIINGKEVDGDKKEILEVKNAWNAYEKITDYDPYSISDFLYAHSLMTDGLVKESGKFRKGNVGVFSSGKLVHPGARPQYISDLVSNLFEWANGSDYHPLIKSCVVHFELEFIHPFADGNGRIGRLWQSLILSKWQEIFAWIPIENVIYENNNLYYKALNKSEKLNDSGFFVEFMLQTILETIKDKKMKGEIVPKNKPSNKPSNKSADDGINNSVSNLILEAMQKDKSITANELVEKTNASIRTIERAISKLQKEGKLKRVGSRKTGYWEVKGS